MSEHANLDEAALARPRFSDAAADSHMRVQRPQVTPDADAPVAVSRPSSVEPPATSSRDTAFSRVKRTWGGMKRMGNKVLGAAGAAASSAVNGMKWLGRQAVNAAGWAKGKAVRAANAVVAAPGHVNEAVKSKTADVKERYGTGAPQPVPFQKQREQALAAEGSTVTVREAQRENADLEQNVSDLKSSMRGAALGMVSTAAVGANLQKGMVHVANLRRANNQETINRDPQRLINADRTHAALADADAETAAAIGSAPMVKGSIRPGFNAKGVFRGLGRQVIASAKLSIARQATGQDSSEEIRTKHTLGKQDIDTSPVSSAPASEHGDDPDAVRAPLSSPNPDLPTAPKPDRYKGGLDPTMKAEDVPHGSWVGKASLGLKNAGKAVKEFGGYADGSTSATEQALADGDVNKAQRTAMGGLAKEGIGTAVHFATGGPLNGGTVSTAMKAAVSYGGTAVQGIGMGMSKLGGLGASGEEQRQRQLALSTGERKRQVLEKGINWQGKENHQDTTITQDIVDGATTSIDAKRKEAFGEKFTRNYRR